MKPQHKALLYNFIGFAVFYLPAYFLIQRFSWFSQIWTAVAAAVASSILSPKFQSVRTAQGQKLFMSWLFLSGVREIK
ncbi:hypothetical protein [Flavobacterium silvaticum]|uniref:Uncharacterized protein n=1 Tax=Flavobacterium silvaticum TaxID=1852020 RepID=A0A972FQW4_9FLAO|nr:hypothetical protein [Flavobacterium silvaticum]NMH26828.1 hypothetical protein [Flavobacterium silvaticum]